VDSRILSSIKGNQVIREGRFSLAMCFIIYILQLSYFKIHFIIHSFPLLNYWQYIILFCDLTRRRLSISLLTLRWFAFTVTSTYSCWFSTFSVICSKFIVLQKKPTEYQNIQHQNYMDMNLTTGSETYHGFLWYSSSQEWDLNLTFGANVI